jgi:xanthine dehydrogenase molybdopterin-binding subunit B
MLRLSERLSEKAASLSFFHLLTTALQRNRAGVAVASRRAGAGFGHREFQATDVTIKNIPFLHVAAVSHLVLLV